MGEPLAEIFGYLVLVSAALLLVWELYSYSNRRGEDAWLITKPRLRRRLMMSCLLFVVGGFVIAEARGALNLRVFSHLVTYVVSLTTIAVALLVLAIRDLSDMARNAERHAVEDLKKTIRENAARNPDRSE